MNELHEAFEKLKSLEKGEVSVDDQVILDFCFKSIMQEKDHSRNQKIMLLAVTRALGRYLDVDNKVMDDIFSDINCAVLLRAHAK